MHLRDVPTRVISRIAKLLRLAERDDGPEADNARNLADHLMDKWNIEVDVGFDEDETTSISFAIEAKCVPWRSTLAYSLAELHGCTAGVTRSVSDAAVGDVFYLYMAGDPENLLRLRLHYRYLETEIERLVSGFFIPQEIRHVRALGAARYVSHLVQEHLQKERDDAEPEPEPEPELDAEESRPEAAEEEPTALMRFPRRQVRVPEEGSEAEDALPDHVLELELPEEQQDRGVQAANGVREIFRYAAKPPPALELPVEAISMGGKKAKKILRELGIRYVGELVAMRASQLKAVPGVGRGTLSMIENDLAFEGLHLRPEDVFSED